MNSIYCNKCGRLISSGENKKVTEKDWFTGEKVWGYFSGKDGKSHRFYLCECCYDHMVEGFALPVFQDGVTELLNDV